MEYAIVIPTLFHSLEEDSCGFPSVVDVWVELLQATTKHSTPKNIVAFIFISVNFVVEHFLLEILGRKHIEVVVECFHFVDVGRNFFTYYGKLFL